ncbi:DUF5819 family protein [Actinomycetota bacterium Odt1-20B]
MDAYDDGVHPRPGEAAADPSADPSADPVAGSSTPPAAFPASPASPASPPPPHPPAPPRPGIAGLPLGYQLVAALALAVIAVTACVHVGMVFLHVAPSNTVSKKHSEAVDWWVYPEFEQNWKLFAPNPLQQNVAVQARAEFRTADGGTRTTEWYDLSAQDGADIDGNPLPSHIQQNELRRAWDFYVGSHDAENRPSGLRGQLSERYVRRIVLMRIDREQAGGPDARIERVQIRSRTTNVRPPRWSDEKTGAKPVLRLLPWWTVTPEDMPLRDEARTKTAAQERQTRGNER